jgi:predicted transglutaminase-like cysteine proteinase
VHFRPNPGVARFVCLCLCAAVAVTAAGSPSRAHKPGMTGNLFEFVEHIVNFQAQPFTAPIRFPKWEDALNRFYADPYPHGYEPFVQQWNAFLATIRNDTAYEQVRRVQEYVNFFSYVRDAPASAGSDYWKTPAEFFTASGDCEDYVIAKYWSLRKLGFQPADLRILVVYARRAQTAHTVLRVRIGGGFLLLDNLYDRVRPMAAARGDYIGLYALNEKFAYLFRQRDRLDSDVSYIDATTLSIFDIPTSAGGGARPEAGE